MHVVVVGAGEVGSYVAERLSREDHDVALVDIDGDKLARLEERLDVLPVTGSGTNPGTLTKAGADHADLLLAVTADDAVNLVSSMVGKSLGVPRTIVRIEEAELRDAALGVVGFEAGPERIIDPDAETAELIVGLLDVPGADEVARMADGEVIVIGARLGPQAPIVGRTLGSIGKEFDPEWDFVIAAIGRDGETVIPRKDHRLLEGDHVRVVARRGARTLVMELLGLDRNPSKRVMLLGGGRTAELLAPRLSRRGMQVVVVERDPLRARRLAETLENCLVLEGDITDAEVLGDADIGSFETIVATTGEDDANLLACLLARSKGTEETIAVLHRLEFTQALDNTNIVDVVVSPRTVTADAVLRIVRGDVVAVATFLGGDAELIELEVKADSPADGALVRELALRKDALITARVRDGNTQIVRASSRLRARDRVVVAAMPGAIDEVLGTLG